MKDAAAAAKSLQSCPTLRDPMDCSPPGSSVHGIFQARVLEWGAIEVRIKRQRKRQSLKKENSAVATGLERSVFIPISKKGNAQECSNYCTIAPISHTSMEKSMSLHSSTLAWKVPWMEEPGGLQSMGSRRVGHD